MANDIVSAGATQKPVVEITSGKLRGASSAGVYAFRAVPYGASTAGRNRFMAPRPPQPWSGVRDALAHAGHAPQSPNRPKRRPELDTILGPPDATPEGEDCLTLNVWTPGLGDGAKRPVMVWLHGAPLPMARAIVRSPMVPIWRGAATSSWSASTIASIFLGFCIWGTSPARHGRIRGMPGFSTLSLRCVGCTRISIALAATPET